MASIYLRRQRRRVHGQDFAPRRPNKRHKPASLVHRRTGMAMQWLAIAAAAVGLWVWQGGPLPQAPARLVAVWIPGPEVARPRASPSNIVYAPARAATMPARAMPACGFVRRNCVVDGDTIWLDGEKIRLEGIDTPEIAGRCSVERDMAQRAKRRLVQLVSGEPLTVRRNGRDRYGRTLATISAGGRELGGILVQEKLARPYAGGRRPWC